MKETPGSVGRLTLPGKTVSLTEAVAVAGQDHPQPTKALPPPVLPGGKREGRQGMHQQLIGHSRFPNVCACSFGVARAARLC